MATKSLHKAGRFAGENERTHDMPSRHYCHGDSAGFEIIDEVEAQPDRFSFIAADNPTRA
jgi:hypothetical protein